MQRESRPWYATITAGARVDAEFARAIGTQVKALAPIAGRPVIDAAIDAARAIGVGGIAVVGGAQVRAHCASRVDRVIDETADGAENLRRALAAWPGRDLVYLTSDLPFVDGPGLADFAARAAGSDVAIPLADAAEYERRFPGTRVHLMELGGERFANGSVFLLAAPAIPAIARVAPGFFDARKSALRMAALLGPALLCRYLTRSLRVADIERRAARVLGVRARAVRAASPGLCYDVDTLAAWRFARRIAGDDERTTP